MASIFSSTHSSNPKPKTHITLGTLPPFIDPKQPPTKKSPWHQIHTMPFISSLTLTLPQTMHTTLWPHLAQSTSPQSYAKVILTLSQILTDPFFGTYIKKGNILLLSEGTPGVSNWLCRLHDGQIRLEMAREVYERCGLQGRPADGNGGARKHGKDRWVVELDLRAPSMVSGKKGFERLLRAAKEVLVEGRVWLFRDLGMGGTERENVVDVFHPTVVDMVPLVKDLRGVLVPNMVSTTQGIAAVPSLELHEDYLELVEWLDLVRLGSTRVLAGDKVDAYISRYSVPEADLNKVDLKTVMWTGLLDRGWCTQLLIDVVRLSRKMRTKEWAALSINSHRTDAVGQVDGCVVLLQPGVREPEHEPGPGLDTTGFNEMDVDASGPGGEVSTTTEEAVGDGSGLQRFMCFQFVGTVRP